MYLLGIYSKLLCVVAYTSKLSAGNTEYYFPHIVNSLNREMKISNHTYHSNPRCACAPKGLITYVLVDPYRLLKND